MVAIFEQLDKLLEMDRFLAYLVLESILWDWDGYPMNRNNYRVYHDPKKDKISFIPSGMDQMLGDPRGPILPNFQGLIARAVIDTPEGKKRYYEKMADILKNVFVVETLHKRLDELETRITPALTGIDANLGRDYKNQVNRLRDAIKVRAKSVEDQLAKVKK